MRSKKDILWSFPQGESEPYGHVPVNRIYEAMDQYSRQMAIDFVEWIMSNYLINSKGWFRKDFHNNSYISTEDAFNVFLQSIDTK